MIVKVIGCGNPLASDDGVGVRVIRELKKLALPKEVEIIEAGNDPFRLIDLIRGASTIILVDAVLGDGLPGIIHRLSLKNMDYEKTKNLSLHRVNILEILKLCRELYPLDVPENIIIFGVEVLDISPFNMGLSEPVEKAIPVVVDCILQELTGK